MYGGSKVDSDHPKASGLVILKAAEVSAFCPLMMPSALIDMKRDRGLATTRVEQRPNESRRCILA